MVLEAVREDRTPGGRNDSAIYNMYRMKYRKTKRAHAKPYSPPSRNNSNISRAATTTTASSYDNTAIASRKRTDYSVVKVSPVGVLPPSLSLSSSSSFCTSLASAVVTPSSSSASASSASPPSLTSSTDARHAAANIAKINSQTRYAQNAHVDATVWHHHGYDHITIPSTSQQQQHIVANVNDVVDDDVDIDDDDVDGDNVDENTNDATTKRIATSIAIDERYRSMHVSPACSPRRLVPSTNVAEDGSASTADFSPHQHNDFTRSTPTRKNLIQKLIEIDRLDSLINLRGLKLRNATQIATETRGAAQRLSHIGDEIVEKLVEWTKTLPFYNDLPVEVHTHLLTQRWAELVLLSVCFYAYNSTHATQHSNYRVDEASNNYLLKEKFPTTNCQQRHQLTPAAAGVHANLRVLQDRLSAVMAKYIPHEHVSKEAGLLVEKYTELYESFCKLRITLEAYVCLKVITILHYTPPVYENEEENIKSAKIHALYARKVCVIQDQFVKALQIHLSQCEDGPRLSEILNWQPALRVVATALLQSKMFYVPFLICKMPDALTSASATAVATNNSGSNNRPAVNNNDGFRVDEIVGDDDDDHPQNDETDGDEDEDVHDFVVVSMSTSDS